MVLLGYMKETIPPVEEQVHATETTPETVAENSERDYSVKKIDIDPETQKDIEDLAAELKFRESNTNKEVASITQKKESGGESGWGVFKKSESPKSRNWFRNAAMSVAAVFALGGAAKAETANPTDSLDEKPTAIARTTEDSVKSMKPNTAEVKKMGISWIEANETVGGLDLEAKAIVPFSDTTKQVWILKFASGSASEMIAAAKNGGYKILSGEDFKKMYTENQGQSKKMIQTFCGEKSTDVDDTKAERYQKVTDNTVETNLKQTHAVYPYIGLTGSLTRFEESEGLNYESGLAVYKENK